jgi:hypothetical protein
VAAVEAQPYFPDLEVAAIEGGSHSVFYVNLDETVGHILAFCLPSMVRYVFATVAECMVHC